MTVIAGLITDDEAKYSGRVDGFVNWCHVRSLHLNTYNTKKIIFHSRESAGSHRQMLIKSAYTEVIN